MDSEYEFYYPGVYDAADTILPSSQFRIPYRGPSPTPSWTTTIRIPKNCNSVSKLGVLAH
jgi:hypothetical protein